ncbi:MAG: hypothetical protein M0Z33_13475, partial [Actinomycetota bacterium]|nr:hypothetical protein [Actinomycetota bacterium]
VSVRDRAGRRVEELQSERDVLLASLEDLDREHAAGDLADEDYEAIRARYVEGAARALRALESAARARTEEPDGGGRAARAGRPAHASRAVRSYLGRTRVRRMLGAVGVLCALGLVVVAAARAAGVRLPGQSATGTVGVTGAARVRQELDQAAILASAGQLTKAIAVYDTILSSVPRQPEALAYKGWFVRLAGIARHSEAAVSDGDALLAAAVAAAPGYAEARAFYAVSVFEDRGDARSAVVQFAAMLRDHPAATLTESVAPVALRAYSAARAGAPRAFAAAAAPRGTR